MDIRTTHWIAALLISIAAHALVVHLVYKTGAGGPSQGRGVAVQLGDRSAFSEPIAAPAETEPMLPPENEPALPADAPLQPRLSTTPESLPPLTHVQADDLVTEAGPEAAALEAVALESAAVAIDAVQPATAVEQAIKAAPGSLTPVRTETAVSLTPGEVAATDYAPPSGKRPASPAGGADAPSEDGQYGTASGGDAGLAEDYYAQLAAWLGRHKRYPRRARKNGQEGTVEVEFVIDGGGRLLDHRILSSSGIEVLDDEALALIERAAPMPPIPDEMDSGSLTVTAPITFSLR